MSAGNHAQAVAYHATRLGIDATIVMPTSTPFVKVQRTRELGATVVLLGEGWPRPRPRPAASPPTRAGPTSTPSTTPTVIAGQGTCALEMLADQPDLDVLVVPVGGGGLLAGMAVAARHLRPDIELVGVQTERYPAMADRVHHTTSSIGGSTIAEGIAVPRPGSSTAASSTPWSTTWSRSREEHIEEAMNLLLEIEKVVAEGAGATGIAALIEHGERFAGRRSAWCSPGATSIRACWRR